MLSYHGEGYSPEEVHRAYSYEKLLPPSPIDRTSSTVKRVRASNGG